MPRRAKTSRLFDNKLFTLRYRVFDKAQATRLAKEIRQEGSHARVIPTSRGTYWVWQGPQR